MGFIESYFLDPIRYGTGYNIVNTLFYAAVLGLLVLFTIHLFRRLELKLDGRFYSFFIPFVLLGSSLRVLRDMDVITSNLFKTPGIYALIYTFLLGSILLGLLLRRYAGIPYHYLPLAVGWISLAWALRGVAGLSPKPGPLLVALAISAGITASVYYILRRAGHSFLDDRVNRGILSAHMLDASATFLGISSYGLVPQHVFPKAIIGATHPAVMYPLKLAVVLPAIYYLKDVEDGTTRDIVKAILLTLGLAPGVRDILMVMVVA